MRRFIQSKLALILGAALFAGYFAVGALAAPDVTPWPDPFDSGSEQTVGNDEPEADETPEADEPPEADETPDADETPEAQETPEGDEPRESEETPEFDVDVEVEEATPGVPANSPACVGTEAD